MNYSLIITVLTVCSAFMCSCGNKTSSSKQDDCTKTDTLCGVVGPGTAMHSLQVCQTNPMDTTWYAIDDATDVANANLLIGNPVEVVYKKTAEGNTAIKITGNATYAAAIGQWTMPDPIAPDKGMGVNIEVDGVASSIGMATLVYKSWELTQESDKIILKGESIGNGQSFAFADTATIHREDGKSTLTLQGTKVVYTKQ